MEVRNRSEETCTLQGEVPTTITSAGRTLDISYSHSVNDEARTRLTTMRRDDEALLRIDWSSPYCGPKLEDQTLSIELPHDGGTLLAPVVALSQPGCGSSELHPEQRSVLSAGTFEETNPTQVVHSPYDPVTVTASGPPTAAASSRIRYVVTVTNPTGSDIVMSPCGGYSVELGVAGGGVERTELYRLNCRTRNAIPAGSSLRFEMFSTLPPTAVRGSEVVVAWQLLDLGRDPVQGRHFSRFIVKII